MKKNLIILAFFILLALSLNITNYYILFPLSLIGIGILNITVFQILSKCAGFAGAAHCRE
jgi:hypothetical protein